MALMPLVQLLFDFAREQFGLFGGSGGRRVAKRPRLGKVARARGGAAAKRRRPVLALAPAVAPEAVSAGAVWHMARPPRGIDHERPSQRRYDAVVVEMLAKYGLTVKRWRNSLSGVAVQRT